ncbi:MAG TPA: nicotinate-nucleotide--dimethylbenzimidazole phosphoribosyltransferase, partial [Alphaproteobacteria bacterium]|nr:nicotinate-nucleotide--dimethylbenzimidazole phosphoribosyltransferase [Alphaproteobacteria bacterium]
MTVPSPVGSFAEIRRLIETLPGPDTAARAAAEAREPQLTKPPGALGRLEEIAAWLAAWQGRHPPTVDHPRVAVFAGNHGIAARGVSAYPASVTAQMVKNFVAGGAAINQICRTMNADLRVYEMALDEPTADFTEAPALGEEACVKALAYGMMAVEPGIDLLCVGEMGVANTTAASAIA